MLWLDCCSACLVTWGPFPSYVSGVFCVCVDCVADVSLLERRACVSLFWSLQERIDYFARSVCDCIAFSNKGACNCGVVGG
jgi:hypothetical protein